MSTVRCSTDLTLTDLFLILVLFRTALLQPGGEVTATHSSAVFNSSSEIFTDWLMNLRQNTLINQSINQYTFV